MDDIIREVNKLDDATLRRHLIDAKIPIGPIVRSTRPIFEKKLVKFKARQSGVWPADDPPKCSDESPPTCNTSTVDGPQTSTPKRTASDSYFVVCIPVIEPIPNDIEFATPSKAVSHLFEDQKEALKLLKKNPGARFKVFRSRKDAESFAGLKENLSTPRSVEVDRRMERNSVGSKPTLDSPNEYHSPKSQQYVALRRALVSKDKKRFNELVWDNPRYLITSGDTPTVLQEGPRYNAVHICAQKDLIEMCSLVLDTLQNPEFIQLMYPGEEEGAIQRRTTHIVDLYLNVPDKGNNETPLHFACKFGCVDMVKYLLSYPMCDRSLKNRYNQAPAEIICSRVTDDEDIKKRIKEALDPLESDDFYVPVFRTEDNTSPPQIGQPWSPASSDSQSEQSYGSLRSPIDIDWNVKAFAGPMSPKEASCLYQKWKGRWTGRRNEDMDIQRSDDEKGMERIGRKLSQSAGVPWKEYWDFLDEFVDLSATDGLQKLDRHLATKCQEVQERLQESNRRHQGSGDDVVQDLNRQFNVMDIHQEPDVALSLMNNNTGLKKRSRSIGGDTHIWTNYRINEDNRTELDNVRWDPSQEDNVSENNIKFSAESENGSSCEEASSSLDDLCNTFSSLRLNNSNSSSNPTDSEEDSSKILSTDDLSKCNRNLPNHLQALDTRLSRQNEKDIHSAQNAVEASDTGSSVSKIDSRPAISISSEDRGNVSLSDGSLSMPDSVFSSPENSSSSSAVPAMRPMDCRFYIIGGKPSRRDMDVYHALRHVPISDDFPYIKRWTQLVDDVSDDLRSKWPTPRRKLRRSTSNPILLSTPNVRGAFTFSPGSIRHLSPLQPLHRASPIDQDISSPRVSEHTGLPVARLFTE